MTKDASSHRDFSDPRCRSFTLIELLIVISIIALLIAIMTPSLHNARRRVLVMACPIAYSATDWSLWITDPRGKRHLKVSDGPAYWARWSPSGDRMVHEFGGGGSLAIVDPVADTVKIIATPGSNNSEWYDGQTVLGFGSGSLWLTSDVESGSTRAWMTLPEAGLGAYPHVYTYPHLTDGAITCEPDQNNSNTLDVYIRERSNWNRTKTIWEDTANNQGDHFARPDWLGERVAWTRNRNTNSGGERHIALKSLDDPPNLPPTIIGDQFANAIFCDWTPDQKLLVIVDDVDELSLVIMGLDGGGRGTTECKMTTTKTLILLKFKW